MSTEHLNIVDPEIHEPKDISSSSNGQVYISNGVGSGSWTSFAQAVSTVVVNAEADFPTPSAGVITLAVNTSYMLGAPITTANRFVPSNNSQIISSSPQINTLTYSGTGIMFSGSDVDFRIASCRIDAPTASEVFSFTDTVGGVNVFDSNLLVIENCLKFGTFTDFNALFFTRVAALNIDDGILIQGGANVLFVIDELTFLGVSSGATFTGIDLGTSVCKLLTIRELTIESTVAGAIGISGLTAGGNIITGSIGRVRGCAFLGSITALNTIDSTDLQWDFQLNVGIPSSVSDAQGSIDSNAVATTFGGTDTPVKAAFGTGFVADIEQRFTMDNTGRATFLGLDNGVFVVDVTLFATISGGASRQYTYYITKNDTIIASSRAKTEYDGNNPGSNGVTSVVELITNDYIELWVEANTATTALTVDTMSLKMVSR